MKSNYTYSIQDTQGRNVIAIEDLNSGGMSVTNNIENIIKEISDKENINMYDYMYVYLDSNNTWDGFNIKNNRFISLNEKTSEAAIRKYINLQLSNLEK